MIAFETRVDEIVRFVAPHFRGLRPEAREEAVQNTLCLAWKYFVRLMEQGKADDETVFRSMVLWAVEHTRQGRTPQGRGSKPKDVIDYARRGKRGVAIEAADLNHFVSRSTSVSDVVAFRVDTEAFLDTLSERHRRLAMDLAAGMTTTEAAKSYGVSPGAVSQFRSRFRKLYEEYHGVA